MPREVSRRAFLRLAAAATAGTLLAACQPKVVEVTKEVEKVVKETVIVQEQGKPADTGEKVVRILLSAWAVGEIPFDTAAREFNEAHPGVNVQIQTSFEGWDTKVIAQINDGTLEWCAAGILTPFLDMQRWVATQMIQPMDDYIAASSEAGAADLLSDMIPTVKDDASYEGKFYSVPYSFENITFNWRVDYFNAVGATEAPETWDDWLRIAVELKKWGADQQIYPTAFAGQLWTDIGALACAAMDNPYTADGLIDWEAPELIECLAFYKRLIVEEELTPPHGSDGWLDAYYSGKVASVQAQSSRGVWGQNAFGTDKVATSPIATKVEGGGAGSVYWGNGVALLNGAKYPQEAMDYIVYTMGPQNTNFQKTVIKTGKTPVYNSAYEQIIKGDPQFGIYQWMVDMLDDVNRSVVPPRNNYYTIQNTMFQKHRVPFTEPGSVMTPEECAQLILKDSQDEIAKQKL
jgi:ABC-type glycerol-3-phosphate transport system substrate-binding protein